MGRAVLMRPCLCGAARSPDGEMCRDCRQQIEFDESLPWYKAARGEELGIPRYAAAVDRNQKEIVEALERAGCDVYYLKKPVDLAVGRCKRTYFLEIKAPKAKGERGGKFTPEQEDFFATWRGHVARVETVEQALRAVGLLGE